jgi:hypothetical protein
MTVSDLKQKLSAFPDDMLVVVDGHSDCHYSFNRARYVEAVTMQGNPLDWRGQFVEETISAGDVIEAVSVSFISHADGSGV